MWRFPTDREDLGVILGERPGTAVRVRQHDCEGGCVHLEQLAYSPTIGWYRQKTFCVPREMLDDLTRTLNHAKCLMPPAQPTAGALADASPIPFPGPLGAEADTESAEDRDCG